MDIGRIVALFVIFVFLSLFFAGWIRIELNPRLSDAPMLARFIILLIVLPMWIVCLISLSKEVIQW